MSNHKTYAERWNRVFCHIRDNVPELHLDMAVFLDGHPQEITSLKCGTAACVTGWTALLYPDDWRLEGCLVNLCSTADLALGGVEGFGVFMGINSRDASYLCGDDEYECEERNLSGIVQKHVVLERMHEIGKRYGYME